MIKSFGCKETEKIYNRIFSKKFPRDIQRIAMRKLWIIDAADNINDLRFPPANHLEKLIGNLKDFYSIRINRKWRIIFKWQDKTVNLVKIINYH